MKSPRAAKALIQPLFPELHIWLIGKFISANLLGAEEAQYKVARGSVSGRLSGAMLDRV